MLTVAFMGLGNMGIGMAGRVLAAGHTLQVYNRTAARAEGLVARGARLFIDLKSGGGLNTYLRSKRERRTSYT